MSDWAGTRAEREWLATLRRLADALERIAKALEENAVRGLEASKGLG